MKYMIYKQQSPQILLWDWVLELNILIFYFLQIEIVFSQKVFLKSNKY